MKTKPSKKAVRIILTAASVLWLAFIFLNSALDGDSSSAMSGWALEFVQSVLDMLSVPLTLTEHFVRKAAHFTEYFILGALVMPTVLMYQSRRRYIISIPVCLAVCFAAACFDEMFIQARVPGRCASMTDSFIDLSGAAAAVLAVCFIVAVKWRRSKLTEE
ncbi:MAG: VanZ family protein [Ruminococcaceae bacterium]|nr:VanZ family protein [Oscillospiraceae bacterium]